MYYTISELRKPSEHFSDISNVITYHTSGRLGDFIYQLSIIHQKFVTTGKKGILYVSSDPEPFAFGIERAYQDTKSFVCAQPYIEAYYIHQGEPVDVRLSDWRSSLLVVTTHWSNAFKNLSPWIFSLLDQQFVAKSLLHNFHSIFSNIYNVDWAKTPWLFSSIDQRFVGKTLVHCSKTRFPKYVNIHSLCNTIDPASLLFITMNPDEHTHFVEKTGYTIERFVPSTLDEFMSAVCSCEMFIGNLSSPLTYAYGFHKKSITLLDTDNSTDKVGVMGLENIVHTTMLSHLE